MATTEETSSPTKPTKKANLLVIAAIVFGLLVFCCFATFIVSELSNNSTTGSTNTNNNVSTTENKVGNEVKETKPEEEKPQEKESSKFITFKDGTFMVPNEVAPGTYRTRNPSTSCYWSRLSGFSGDYDEILANGNEDSYVVVTIKSGDKGFNSTRCGTWSSDLSQVTVSKTEFGSGMYIVGTDIESGTYKSSEGSSCYWSRLSGFSGDYDEIIANDNTKQSTIVTIASSDKGFSSVRCGTWKKIK